MEAPRLQTHQTLVTRGFFKVNDHATLRHMADVDRLEITPAARIGGVAAVPGDKAISHRLALIGGIAEGTTVIRNFAESADCASTLECLKRLGAPIQRSASTVTIDGRGLNGLKAPSLE